MSFLNRIATTVFDWTLGPMASLSPLLALLVWSALVGALMAVTFRFTSNQRALRAAAARVRANLLAIKLFQHDLGVTMRCQLGLLGAIVVRLWHSLPPLLVMIVPLALMLAQLGLRFEHTPAPSGEPTVVQLCLSPRAWQRHRDVSIQVPPGVRVETAPLRDDREHAVYWRVSSSASRPFAVRWQLDDRVVEKRIDVAAEPDTLTPVSVQRPGASWFDQLLHPAEPPFAARSPVEAVIVHHARRTTPIFGLDIPWWLTFLITSCASAWLLRPLMRVQF